MAIHEPHCRYDVFLSFRGQDTRHGFTGYLFDALRRKGINTFMDDDGLKGGDQISLSLVKAIEHSIISIVVFSENYASSRWCLDELVKIVECMKTKNQLVWPIFYKVEPSDVRNQTNSYREAMTKHESRFRDEDEKVQNWRRVLSQVADLKGWHFKPETGSEYEFIKGIVEQAAFILHPGQLCTDDQIIGHQSRLEEAKSLLDIESSDIVCMMGIHGTGGIGKTTLAKSLFDLIVDRFECAVFLENVRETSNNKGLVHLQELVLSHLLEGKTIKLSSIDEGVARLKRELRHKKLLLVLDDVHSVEQLDKIAGKCNWFGSGSRIIITTRDKHLLNVHEVEKRYKVQELRDHEALQLFCWNAFKLSQPKANYEDVSNHAVRYTKGLPLALKVIGSNLVGKSPKECQCALEQYERFPDKKIQDILKVSYDCLPENAQHVFLDIACFFKGERREYVEDILENCDFYPIYNIGILVDKSLITVDECGCIKMHDLVQDMAKEVVRQEAPKRPGERSRLCFHEDVLHVVKENLGSSNIEGIILDPPGDKEIEIEWDSCAFKKMNNLRILIVRNACFLTSPNYLPDNLRLLEWKRYPFESLPPSFYPKNMVVLRLPDSHLKLVKEKPFQRLEHLTDINFSSCQSLTHIPDVSGIPNLKRLDIRGCKYLSKIHDSVGSLGKLEGLYASRCTELKHFPATIRLPSLQYLDFDECRSLKFFPNIGGVMDKISYILLDGTQIIELPHSVHNLTELSIIHMPTKYRNIPNGLSMLPKLRRLSLKVGNSVRRFHNSSVISTIDHCSNLNRPPYFPLRELECRNCGLTDEDLHCILSRFPNLKRLIVPSNNFVVLPTCIKESAKLRTLDVRDCFSLEEIPELPSRIQEVYVAGCPSLTSKTLSMLWNQASNEVYGLQIMMPLNPISTWFDHRCEGGIMSFWARDKFPILALAFLCKLTKPSTIKILNYVAGATIDLYINGLEVDVFYLEDYPQFTSERGHHAVLFDLRPLLLTNWPIILPMSGWNYIKLKYDISERWTVTHCGAHIYKQETNIDDIQFTCPNKLKRRASMIHNQPKKRTRKLKPKNKSKGRIKENKMARRRSAQFQSLSCRRRMRIVFPMRKWFWRFFY